MKARLVLLGIVSALVAGCLSEDPVARAERSIAAADSAFALFRDGHFHGFRRARMQAIDDGLLSMRPSASFPEISMDVVRAGTCHIGSIQAYARAVEGLARYIPLLTETESLTLSQRIDLADFLSRESNVLRNHGGPEDHELDCDRLVPGYSDRIQSVIDYRRHILPAAVDRYTELVGHDPYSEARSNARSIRENDINNWNSLSAGARARFTEGDPEVANCVSSFVGASPQRVQGASTLDVVDLCRSGLTSSRP